MAPSLLFMTLLNTRPLPLEIWKLLVFPSSNMIQHSSGGAVTEPVHEKGFGASLFGGEDEYKSTVYNRSLEGDQLLSA
jgi:hypothetical protein